MKVVYSMFTMLLLLTTVTVSRAQFDPNYKGYYFLKTEFRGADEMLEGNQAKSNFMNGAAFMSKQKGAIGQRWMAVAEPGKAGYYRLKNQFRGNGECLEGNQLNGTEKKGTAFMRPCSNEIGQLWKIEPVDNGSYRLKTMFQGAEHSLEGNEINGTMKQGNAILNTAQNVTGQRWKFEPIK